MNIDSLKGIANRTGLSRFYRRIRQWRDNLTCDRFECSVGDILLLREVPSHNQLLLTSRLLDVEDYIYEANDSFQCQNAISYAAYGERHREADGNRSFEKLIASYLKDGYHAESYITCDKDMNLMDGNHRMGLHIYEKIDTVNTKMVHRSIPFQYGGDWYFQTGLPVSFMERIYNRFSEIQDWLVESGNTFCVYLEGEKEDKIKIIQVLNHLCVILKQIDVSSSKGTIIQFRMQHPLYHVVDGKLCSMRAKRIEQILKTRISGSDLVTVSMNCLEGKILIKKYLK